MLLGVYWYYGFPTGLYEFEWFTFRPGRGGLADGPAELIATVQVPDPAALLHQLQALAVTYPAAPLLAQGGGDILHLTLGGYGLPDYTFFVAQQVEAILRQAGATKAPAVPADAPRLPLHQSAAGPARYPRSGLLQVVASAPRRHHAETLALRLDCHLPLNRKTDFLAALAAECAQADLAVLYYFDYELADHVNLMVFFSNGRQGVGGQPLRYTNGPRVEAAVQRALTPHGGQPKHLGGFPDHYPQRGPHVVRVVDAEFVL